jgi:hypothetical protein
MIGRRVTRQLAAVLALAGLLAPGCSRRQPHVAGDGRWLAEIERRNALADERVQAKDWPGAQAALRGIVDTPAPADAPADDVRRVRQDAYFRLAKVDLDASEPKHAIANADRGLALGRAGDLFVANLLVVRGAAHEALGEDPAAAEDYHQALVINDKLLGETLQGGDAARAPEAAP